MKKKMMTTGLLLTAILLTSAFTPVATNAGQQLQQPRIQLEGQLIDFTMSPKMMDGVLMASVRDLAKVLNMEVTWNEAERAAVVTRDGYELKLPMNSDYAYVNGKANTMYGATQIVDGSMYVPLRFFMESANLIVRWDSATQSVNITKPTESLPVVGTYDHLVTLLTQNEGNSFRTDGLLIKEAAKSESSSASTTSNSANASSTVSDSKAMAPAYSGTNVQVQGVDESDVVKTDGTYIYSVNKQRIVVTAAYPADQMKVLSILDFPNDQNNQFQPSELYVDDQHLIVLGHSYQNYSVVPQNDASSSLTEKKMSMPFRGQQTTKVMVYDLSDRSHLKLVKEAELEGSYISSRKIGSSLYFISNKYVNYYQYREMMNKEEAQTMLAPAYRDSSVGDSFTSISLDRIYYLPKALAPNYVLIGGINLDDLQQTMHVTSFLGSGQNVYASEENLYVASTTMEQMRVLPMPMPVTSSSQAIRVGEPNGTSQPIELPKQETIIYQFGLNAGEAVYKHTGKVPGYLLNQFAMDEHNGYFRVATTTGEIWRTDVGTSKNHVYILDANLQEKGKIENIAPGERIYSTRFMGDRAYMVTFKNTDPLFVIDLKDPSAPKLLGALKIPGYSNYLHPYDENHIIGFGKDTVEVDNNGKGPQSFAYYQGMKMALFDVSDVNHPVEQFKELIGDRGTDSELLYNHRALLFSKENGLLAFPVNVMKVDPNQAAKDPKMSASAYGSFAFQGAYVYHLDLEKGFQFRGGITHLTPEEQQKAGQYFYAGDKQVQRALYIGDTLYTVSNSIIKANDISTLQEKNSVIVP